MLKITTNNVPYPLKMFVELPEKEQKWFDYVSEKENYSLRFVNYKGVWYDTHDCQGIRVSDTHDRPMGWAMYVNPDDPLAKWHAVHSDSFSSGVLFRFVGDDQVVCGTYMEVREQ